MLVSRVSSELGFLNALNNRPPHHTNHLTICQPSIRWGEPLSLESELPRVDIIVVGSVAVDPVSGARIGKGEGFMEVRTFCLFCARGARAGGGARSLWVSVWEFGGGRWCFGTAPRVRTPPHLNTEYRYPRIPPPPRSSTASSVCYGQWTSACLW